MDDSNIANLLCKLGTNNEDTRKQAIEGKFRSQFTMVRSEDYQFETYQDMIAANQT